MLSASFTYPDSPKNFKTAHAAAKAAPQCVPEKVGVK